MMAQEARPDPGGRPRGGLLADKMGYGKTATAIGLISLGSDEKGMVQQERTRQQHNKKLLGYGYLKSKATFWLKSSLRALAIEGR